MVLFAAAAVAAAACVRNGGESWLLTITGTVGTASARLASTGAVLGAIEGGTSNELSNDSCTLL